jgi:peptidoglycan/LPS O-acetylase OafA/YrhL
MKIKYYENLDGVRGIAALMVVVFHFFRSDISKNLPHLSIFQALTEFGQHGVSLFFILSGFVITRILMNSKEKPDYFKNFYIRRALRIFPLYYSFLLLWYFVLPYFDHSEFTPFKSQIPFYLYIQNFFVIFNLPRMGPPHFWTLAVEEHFYLVWPLIVYLTPNKRLIWAIAGFVLVSFLIKYYFLTHDLPIKKFTFTRWDQIVMGAGIVLLERKGFFKIPKNFIYVVFLTIFIIIPTVYTYREQSNIFFFKELFKYFFLAIFFGCLLCLLLFEDRLLFLNRMLKLPIMQYFGKTSYGIYVWHMMVITIMEANWFSEIMVLDLLIVTFLTLLAAHLSFKFIEEPFLRFKNRFN